MRERTEHVFVQSADFVLQPLAVYEAYLREHGYRLPVFYLANGKVVLALFRTRREWHDEARVEIELLEDDHGALKRLRAAVLLKADVRTESAPPHFALME